MNYRHAFHAGNHCDVLKHTALTAILARLILKDKPFFVLDTHAGRGLYDLGGDEAFRSGEHIAGVSALWRARPAMAPFSAYLDAVARENPFGGVRWYPGSPLITMNALRPRDRLHLCELHPDECDTLRGRLPDDPRCKVEQRDGYEAIRALLPPSERRGLVLIDPPFEVPGEFDRICQALKKGLHRWATGVFMIWYPLKDVVAVNEFQRQLSDIAGPKKLSATLSVRASAPGRLSGSGIFIVNPPFGVGAQLAAALPVAAEALAQEVGGGWSLYESEKATASDADHAPEAVIHDLSKGMI